MVRITLSTELLISYFSSLLQSFTPSSSILFLFSFEERLAAQRREKELEAAEVGFKKPLSKEEKVMKKKERLAAIGNISFLIMCL